MKLQKKSRMKSRWWCIELVLAMFVVASIASCTSDGCLGNGSSIPLAAFYTSGTTTSATVSNLTVRGVGVPGDSCIVEKATVKQVYLPLRVTTGTTQFVFDYNNSEAWLNDTVTINYCAVPTFVSKECGAMYCFDIDSYSTTTHRIDSVALPYSTIDNADRVSMKIYLSQ